MKLIKLSDHQYKVSRDAVGSNQHVRIIKRRRHPRVRGMMALMTLVTLLLTTAYLNITTHKAQANEPAIQVVTVTPTPVNTDVKEFIRLQNEWNENALKWMKAQEVINQGI